MAAISAIRIQGFQSHIDSHFNLGNGLNVITGPSGAGKTAVLRAIKYVAFNEPQGEAFVNEKVGEAIVTIYLNNGAIITKRRKKGKTSYLLQVNEEDEGSLYEKSEVPEEVKRQLQIEKQTFGDFETALNFAFQLDAPFLLSETASAGAKILGKLAGTESVDLAIKGVSKDTYGSRQERTNAEKDIERIAGSMLAYQGIDDAQEAIDVAELLLEQIEKNNQRFENMREYSLDYSKVNKLLNTLENRLDSLAIVPQLEVDLEDIEKAQRRYDLLLDLYNTYFSVGTKLTAISRTLQRYETVEQTSEDLNLLDQTMEKLTLLISLIKEYQKYSDVYRKTAEVLEKTKQIDSLSVDIGHTEKGLDRVNELKILSVEYRNVARQLEMAQERAESYQGLNTAETLLHSTVESVDRLAQLKSLQGTFEIRHAELSTASLTLKSAEQYMEQAKTEEAEAWEAAGGICPLCEQPHERGAC